MQILNRYTGAVFKDIPGETLSGADLSGADLSGAILSRANLSGADLSGANLSGANLSGADLSGAILSRAILSRAILSRANLSRAILSGAILSRANLSGAILSGANLSGANLYGAIGDMRHIKSGQIFRWPFAYTDTRLWIGCQSHPIEDWWGFTDDQILRMDGEEGLAAWKVWKPILQQIIAASPAEPTGYVAPE